MDVVVPDTTTDAPRDRAGDVTDAPDSTEDAPSDATSPWRSALYPEDWSPEASTALHDFSYAGYRHGEQPPAGQDLMFDVSQYGASTDEEADNTRAFQDAIDAAGQAEAARSVVYVPPGEYRIGGRLEFGASGVVLRGAGGQRTKLLFTASLATGKAHIKFGAAPVVRAQQEVVLAEDAPARGHTVRVSDASSLTVGQDVALGWTISPAFVEAHGMTGTWKAFNGTWRPFFWRNITAIDTSTSPHTVTLDVPLRYDALTRDGASLRPVQPAIHECGIEAMSVTNAIDKDGAFASDRVHLVEFQGARDCWMRDVHSYASPLGEAPLIGEPRHVQSGGVLVLQSARVSVLDSSMKYPQRQDEGGNGYLFEVSQSSDVLMMGLDAVGGRHNFIQNWGFGTSGCVWSDTRSLDGRARNNGLWTLGYSEFHHSLAMANLIERSVTTDGWSAIDRGSYSTGAGHTSTQNVFWNIQGTGKLRSGQYGQGYIVGTSEDIEIFVERFDQPNALPLDTVEGQGRASALEPQSLYLDQRQRRLSR